MKKVFDMKALQLMALFEKTTKTQPKDCIIQDNQIIFIVNIAQVGTAVGPKGINVKKLEQIFKKKIKIAGFSENLQEFIKSLVAPLQLKEIEEIDDIVELTAKDLKTRGLLIGRNASILRSFEGVIKYKGVKS